MDDWPIIFSYTRAQAIADGVLIDVTAQAAEEGFNRPLQKAVSGYSPPQMTAMSMIPQHRPSTTMTTAKWAIEGC